MIRAGVGLSNNPATEHAAEDAAGRAMERAGIDRADLVLVFFTADHAAAAPKLADVLRRVTRSDALVGSSGAGVLTGDGEIEGHAGLAVLALAGEDLRAQPFLHQPLRGREGRIGMDIAREVSQNGSSLVV